MATLTLRSAFIACLLLWHSSVLAIDEVDIRIGHWSTEQLSAQNFDIKLDLTASGLKLTATAEKLFLPAPLNTLRDVQLACATTQWFSGQLICGNGELAFFHAELGQQRLNFSLSAIPDNTHYQIDITGLHLFDSAIKLSVNYTQSAWQLAIDAPAIQLQQMQPWLARLLDEQQLALLSGWDYSALLSLKMKAAGNQQNLSKLDLDWQFADLSFSNATGSQIAELLQNSGSLLAEKNQNGWQWQASLDIEDGQSYFDPVFLDFSQHPTKLNAHGVAGADLSVVDIAQMTLQQESLLAADIALIWRDNRLVNLKLHTKPAQLDELYPVWLQPFAFGTAAAKLTSSGSVSAHLDWDKDTYQLTLDMDKVSLEDQDKRFKINELSGLMGWSTNQTAVNSQLRWHDAQVYAISLGGAEISAQSVANGLQLTEALNLPVLDGALLVNDFSLKQTNADSVEWTFDGLLTPISMEALSQALEWPKLHGKLSGVIPNVHYNKQQLEINGALQLKVFDGTTVIKDLRMVSPLGSLPQLYANIDIKDIDLELLTRTFDFGRITGRLEGHIHKLRLSDWEPVEFDARLATPDQNPGKRRISQRAVNNLTQIGGGAGMLSRSFLRFFDDFSYQRIGLACKLNNEVCDMSGIEEAEQGYYIVKGGGGLPPWINVVGYTRRVDWSELIERLKSVQQSSGPVIQ